MNAQMEVCPVGPTAWFWRRGRAVSGSDGLGSSCGVQELTLVISTLGAAFSLKLTPDSLPEFHTISISLSSSCLVKAIVVGFVFSWSDAFTLSGGGDDLVVVRRGGDSWFNASSRCSLSKYQTVMAYLKERIEMVKPNDRQFWLWCKN